MTNQPKVSEAVDAPVVAATPLELARKKREEFEAARELTLKAREDELETKRELQELEDLQAFADAQDTYGIDCVELVPSLYGAVVVKRPTKVLYDNWQETGKPTANSMMKLVGPCLVYPSRERFDTLAEAQPALIGHASDAIARLAGVAYKKRVAK